MKLKRTAAFLLAIVMAFGEMQTAYAVDVSQNEQIEEEVSGRENAGSFLFDVSDGEDPAFSSVSGGETGENGDVSENCPDVSAGDEVILEEGPFSFEECHGQNSERVNSTPEEVVRDAQQSAVYYRKYYNQIDAVAQLVYETIEEYLDDFADPSFTITLNLKNYSETLREAASVKNSFLNGFAAFDYDHPEVFWLAPSAFAYTRSYSSETGLTTKITIKKSSSKTSFYQEPYASDPDRIETDRAAMNTNIAKIVSAAAKVTDFADKIALINDWLSNENYYNRYVYKGKSSYASLVTWESVSALTTQTWLTSSSDNGDTEAPVCEGYSRAFKLVCDRLGIHAIQVAGNNHMWNYVQDDVGTWYAVDVTWDDPVRSDEYLVKTTPADDIHKYVLAGSDTVINGSTFISRHPANGAFWKGGTAFDTPDLCTYSYAENEILEKGVYLVSVMDDGETPVSIYDDEFCYFEDLSLAVTKVSELAASYPSRKVILQINKDLELSYDALDDLTGLSNVILSLNGYSLSFTQGENLYIPDLAIYDKDSTGIRLVLTQDTEVTGNFQSPEAVIVAGDNALSIGEAAKVRVKSLLASSFTLKEGAMLVTEGLSKGCDPKLVDSSVLILAGDSCSLNRVQIDGSSYLLRTDPASISLKEVCVEGAEDTLSMGLLEDVESLEDYLDYTREGLPLSAEETTLFTTTAGKTILSHIRAVSGSENEMRVSYKNGTVFTEELLWTLIRTASDGTVTELGTYAELSEVLSRITAVASKSSSYEIVLSGSYFLTGTITFPVKCKSITIRGEGSGRKIYDSASFSLSKNLTLSNLTVQGENLISTANLTLDNAKLYLSGKLTVGTLDMTDSFVDVEGKLSVKSVISRTDSNELLYGPDDIDYLDGYGRVTLLRDGCYSNSFDTVNQALAAITKASAGSSDYKIVINSEPTEEEKTSLQSQILLFPAEGLANSITISAVGDAEGLYFRKRINVHTNVTFENIILCPKTATFSLGTGGYAVTFQSSSLKAGTVISGVTDAQQKSTSGLTLNDTDLTVKGISGLATVSLTEGASLRISGEADFKNLSLSADSSLTALGKTTVTRITSPQGTLGVGVSVKTNKATGEIIRMTPQVTVKKDFNALSGSSLTILPYNCKTGEKVDLSLIREESLKDDSLKVLSTVRLSTESYVDGTLAQILTAEDPSMHFRKTTEAIVLTKKETKAVLTYGNGFAAGLQTLNGAVYLINAMKLARAYTIVLTGEDYGKLYKVPKGDYCTGLTIEGKGKTLESRKGLKFTMPVTVKNCNWVHSSNLTFPKFTEENASLSVAGELHTGNMTVTGENTLDAEGRIYIKYIYGDGTLYVGQKRTRYGTKLNITGKVSSSVRIGIIPFTTDYASLAVDGTPKKWQRLIYGKKTGLDSFFFCDEDHQEITVDGKKLKAVRYGNYICVEISEDP